jgi:hypothetical protein
MQSDMIAALKASRIKVRAGHLAGRGWDKAVKDKGRAPGWISIACG